MDPRQKEGSASHLQMAEEEESRKNENTNLNSSKRPHFISDAWTGAQCFRNFQSLSFFLTIPLRDLQKNQSCSVHNHAVTKSWSHALNRPLQLSPGHPLTASEDLCYCATLPVVFLSLLFGFPALSFSSLSLSVSLSLSRKWRTQAPPYGYDHPLSLRLLFCPPSPPPALLFFSLSVSSSLTNNISHYSAKIVCKPHHQTQIKHSTPKSLSVVSGL